jgi:uncharacterized protein (DUF1501 family)
MRLTRRDFLKTAAVSSSAYFLPRGPGRALGGSTPDPVMVALFLRGGADPLNLVVPIQNDQYALYTAARPDIGLPKNDTNFLLPLDGDFELNILLQDIHARYNSGDMLILHASGSKDPSRSHFDAQDFMQKAAPGDVSVTDGWLNRFLQISGSGSSWQGISLSDSTQLTLLGNAPNVAFKSIAGFGLSGDFTTERRDALEALYAGQSPTVLSGAVGTALSAVDVIAGVDTSTSVVYPAGKLGPALKDVAAIIKAEIGAKVYAIELGGWDHHSNMQSELSELAPELAGGLKAFYDDLGTSYSGRVLTLCMTEFGRRVAQNGGGGADHGHAGIMFALGGGIAGGRVVNDWPGLEPENLYEGEDLDVTIDFRDIFAEALHKHMGVSISDLDSIFPDFTPKQSDFPGIYL